MGFYKNNSQNSDLQNNEWVTNLFSDNYECVFDEETVNKCTRGFEEELSDECAANNTIASESHLDDDMPDVKPTALESGQENGILEPEARRNNPTLMEPGRVNAILEPEAWRIPTLVEPGHVNAILKPAPPRKNPTLMEPGQINPNEAVPVSVVVRESVRFRGEEYDISPYGCMKKYLLKSKPADLIVASELFRDVQNRVSYMGLGDYCEGWIDARIAEKKREPLFSFLQNEAFCRV